MTVGISRHPFTNDGTILPFVLPPGMEGFQYFKTLELKGSTQGPLTNYVMRVRVYRIEGQDSTDSNVGFRKIYVGNRVKPDFSDIRFIDGFGNKCSYFVGFIATDYSYADVWVCIPRIEAEADSAGLVVEYVYGTATASSTYDANYDPSYAFEQLTDNAIGAGQIWSSPALGASTPQWLKMDYEKGYAYVINQYKIFCKSYEHAILVPTKWKLQGSNDDTNWDDLDDHTASAEPAWAVGEIRTYSFKNEKAYRYYRIYLPEMYYFSSYYYVQIPEVALYYCPFQNFVPITSAMISCTSEYEGGYYDHYTVDNSYNVAGGYWLSADRASASATTHLNIDLGSGNEKALRGYHIRAAVANYAYTMKKWKFQGSVDNSTWITLDDRSASAQSAWSGNERRGFQFVNDVAYRYYRFEISEAVSDGSGHYYTSIGEIMVYEFDPKKQPKSILRMLYGCNDATSESSITGTFPILGDDFATGTLDTALWTNIQGTGVAIVNSVLTASAAGAYVYGVTNKAYYSRSCCAVLWKMKPAHPSNTSGSYVEAVRAYFYNDSNFCAAYYAHSAVNQKYYNNNNGSSGTATITGLTSEVKWRIQEARRTLTEISWVLDDNAAVSVSTNYGPLWKGYIGILSYGAGASIDCDWVAVRPYVYPEPSFGWSSPEQAIPVV